jgi:hypothetical protein
MLKTEGSQTRTVQWLRLCDVAILNTGCKMKHCCQFFMSPPIIEGYKSCHDYCGNGTKLAKKPYKCHLRVNLSANGI